MKEEICLILFYIYCYQFGETLILNLLKPSGFFTYQQV